MVCGRDGRQEASQRGAGGELLLNGLLASPGLRRRAAITKILPGMAAVRPDGRSRVDQLPRQMAATN